MSELSHQARRTLAVIDRMEPVTLERVLVAVGGAGREVKELVAAGLVTESGPMRVLETTTLGAVRAARLARERRAGVASGSTSGADPVAGRPVPLSDVFSEGGR